MIRRIRSFDWELFKIGWRRRSALYLDLAGAPLWLTKWRAPAPKGWIQLLQELLKDIAYEDIYDDE